MPPQTIHLALPLTWYDGGTWLSCEPHTISFLGFGRWKRYLGHSSLKRKFSHSSAVNLRYLRANTKRAFLWLLLRSGSFFRLKGSCGACGDWQESSMIQKFKISISSRVAAKRLGTTLRVVKLKRSRTTENQSWRLTVIYSNEKRPIVQKDQNVPNRPTKTTS